MKKGIFIWVLSLLFISACGNSNEDTAILGMLKNNNGDSIVLGDSMTDVYKTLDSIAYDDSADPLEDGSHYFDGIQIRANEGIATVFALTELYETGEIIWETGEGIKIGSTKAEVIEAYKFIAEEEWHTASDFSMDSNDGLSFTKPLEKQEWFASFSFNEFNEVSMIIYLLQ